ncbi:MAG: DNA-binding protein [Campylobacteraceae bacterium]|nr:DNA-binding protein [Campylobacteraceae bacterium]
MIKVGKINQLKIARLTDYGFYLSDGDEIEILLPNAYMTSSMEIGRTIDVFIYHDSENRLVASTLYPKARLGEFALMEVTDVSSFGAFVDWGLPKELFVPLKYQKTPFKIGQKRVILVALDDKSGRLIGVEKFGKFLPQGKPKFEQNEKVELFMLAKTPLGFKAIINNRYEGMLFQNEIFTELEVGEMRYGYIKKFRSDGKIDLSLQPIGEESELAATEKVLKVLRKHDYKMPYSTKSSPEEIYKVFEVSKKSFKAVINSLREEGLIKITENGIEGN